MGDGGRLYLGGQWICPNILLGQRSHDSISTRSADPGIARGLGFGLIFYSVDGH